MSDYNRYLKMTKKQLELEKKKEGSNNVAILMVMAAKFGRNKS